MLRRPSQIRSLTQTLSRFVKAFSVAAHDAAPSHYDVLGVPTAATAEQIKVAFRQRAKDLHPDLNAQWSASDSEAFLRLVTAYEVLSDPQQRQLYDMSTSTELPGVLRRAAAAGAEPHAKAEQQAAHGKGVFSWRYGLADWAIHGPDSVDVTTAESQLQWSVASALSRHRRELEREVHSALVKAFLGPQLKILAGQLPPAFEADERADPSLTNELLHLVHGRELLGVVRIKQHLALEGGAAPTVALPDDQPGMASLPPLPPALPQSPSQHPEFVTASSQHKHDGQIQHDGQPAERLEHDTELPHQQQSMADPRFRHQAASLGEAAGPDDEISDTAWQQLLQEQHPLHGHYDWAATAATAEEPAAAATTAEALLLGPPTEHAHLTSCNATAVPPCTKAQHEDCLHGSDEVAFNAHQDLSWETIGGKAARTAWEQQQALQECCSTAAMSVGDESLSSSRLLSNCERGASVSSSQDQCVPAQMQCGSHQVEETVSEDSPNIQEQQQLEKSTQQQEHKHGKQQRAHKHKARSWSWLRTPSADWCAADWSFDDSSEGVLVLEMIDDRREVTALALRDDTQHNKPCKVYINGIFTAAVLDDVVMEPLTGRLMGVLYRFYTPGVHHLYFYLPSKGASRVLARLQRRWMPPSATWLFPPRNDSHDTGGWSIEWEGHDSQHKPGWMHPAVYVLTVACYSRDMELRSPGWAQSSAQRLWQKASDPESLLGRALQWLRGK